jgi:hypothetical protein
VEAGHGPAGHWVDARDLAAEEVSNPDVAPCDRERVDVGDRWQPADDRSTAGVELDKPLAVQARIAGATPLNAGHRPELIARSLCRQHIATQTANLHGTKAGG